jgi:L-ribulokinase
VALGASIFAAVVGGVYDSVNAAQQKMASPVEKVYYPQPNMVEVYNTLYKKYEEMGTFIEEKMK